ncbi:MAG TPA: hypothetical protein VK466_06325 [Terriglobales bacterium]|nr:hypothetical protein [Terriglobales bacterium]HXZ58751.1 hypothetical protein [Steroidobacteraceae bacterium]
MLYTARTSLLVMSLVLLGSAPVVAQQCTTRTTLKSFATVYENPPHYLTGAGLQGTRTDQLPPGTAVFICRQQNVDFGFSSRVWVQIQYRIAGTQGWRNGWIPQESLTARAAPDLWHRLLDNVIAPAEAQTPPASDEELPPPLPAGATPVSSNDVAWGDLATLYGPLFAALLLGIFAKVGVDCLDDWNNVTLRREKARDHVRNGLIAILVSPIVFLGFLNAGQFPTAKQTFMVLALLAFQNGFFWQTVLKKSPQKA